MNVLLQKEVGRHSPFKGQVICVSMHVDYYNTTWS